MKLKRIMIAFFLTFSIVGVVIFNNQNIATAAKVRSTIPKNLWGTWYTTIDSGSYKYVFTKKTFSSQYGHPSQNIGRFLPLDKRVTYKIGQTGSHGLRVYAQKNKHGFWQFKYPLNKDSRMDQFKVLKYKGKVILKTTDHMEFGRTMTSLLS